MRVPTMGYEDGQEITKSELGCVQLVEAINLFLAKKYICAITLAGASEDIFSGILANIEKQSIAEQSIKQIENLRNTTRNQIAEGLPKKEIFKAWNAARNDLKHHDKGREDKISINLFDEAYWMIQRSLTNARLIPVEIENSQHFENWVIENINM